MKRINYFLATAIALGAIMTSCEKETLIQEDGNDNKMTITAQKEDVSSTETRTSINEKVFTWVAGDKLSLYAATSMGDDVVGQEFTIFGGQNSKLATFEGFLTPQSEPVYAVYPHNTAAYFTSATYTADFVIHQTQTHDESVLNPTSIGQYAYMYGQSEENVDATISSTTDVAISMKHLTAILDFKITDIPVGTKVNFLNLSANSMIIPNTVEVNLANGSSSFSSMGDIMKVSLKTGSVAGVTASGDLTIRLAMLPTTVPADGELTITLQTVKGDVTTTAYVTKHFDSQQIFEAGKVYPTVLELDSFQAQADYSMYPKIDVSSYSIYVYDRNAGISIPGLDTYSAGEAKNWINGVEESDNNVKAFKGDYYTFINLVDNNMCPSGWRMPNYAEILEIKNNIATENAPEYTLTGTNGAICYFPLSGWSYVDVSQNENSNLDAAEGYYWTNEYPTAGAYAGYYYCYEVVDPAVWLGSDYGYSIRCVKTATE